MDELLRKKDKIGVENLVDDICNIKNTLDNIEMILKLRNDIEIAEYKYTKLMLKKIGYDIEKVHTLINL